MDAAPSRWHSSLLRTKLFVPPARSRNVTRPRLVGQLDDALRFGHKLILVSAPPGFGKSTLISDWLGVKEAERPTHREKGASPNRPSQSNGTTDPVSRQVAWLALDPADNDPAHFFLYLCAALDLATGAHDEWDEVIPVLQASAPPPLPVIATILLNVCAGLDLTATAPLVVVLEDYHVIETAEIHSALTYLLDHAPPHLHLILTSRTDPPLPLSRLRARGQLTELRAQDLRFRPEEATELVGLSLATPLTPPQIAALEERTEGWAAGLHLAAIALAAQPRQDVRGAQEFINAFTGSHRYVMDYLIQEVLQGESPEIQNFLIQTAVLDRMCAPLCQYLLDAPSVSPLQSLLELLERRNLFVIALDEQREWYRYHHLFAQVLRHRLGQSKVAEAAALEERASIWFEQNGLGAEAIQYALAAKDAARAARLITQEAERMLERGEHATLLVWLERLPADTLRAHPDLLLDRASACLITHHLDLAEAALGEAKLAIDSREESPARTRLASRAAGIGAMVALNRNDVPRTIALGSQALAHLDAQDVRLRAAVLLHLGVAYDWKGDLVRSEESLSQAHRLAEQAGDLQTALLALANLGAAKRTGAHYRRAAEIFRQGLELEERHNAYHLTGGIYLYTDLADTYNEWNELDLARPLLQEALQRCERFGLTRAHVITLRLWARWHAARGQPQEALQFVYQAIERATDYDLPNHYSAPARGLRARLWLQGGQSAQAVAWAQAFDWNATDKPDFTREEEYYALARVWIHEQAFSLSTPLLQALLAGAEAGSRTESIIWTLRLIALNHAAQNQSEEAMRALERALGLAQPEGFVLSFVEEGEPMRALLKQLQEARRGQTTQLDGYVSLLLTSFAGAAAVSAPKPASPSLFYEPLTDRELQVLALVARGLADKQIAAELVVALGTVKRHLNNIYGKLGVNSRTQALVRAREVGLMDERG